MKPKAVAAVIGENPVSMKYTTVCTVTVYIAVEVKKNTCTSPQYMRVRMALLRVHPLALARSLASTR